MKEKDQQNEFLPGINEYLESVDSSSAISSKGLEEMVFNVRAKTGLAPDVCSAIVSYFFQEIQNEVLRGNVVTIKGLGKFVVSSPKVTSTKERVFVKFIPYKSLIRKLNDRRR